MAIIDAFKFDDNINNELKKVTHYGKDIGENWPVVYLLNDDEEAYVGETHHVSVRMSQHLSNAAKRKLTEMRIITGNDFNKSVILDLEAFLIKHMSSDGKYKLLNGNHGLQDHDYYQRSQYNETFRKIWNKLKAENIVDHTISEIENSTLYKYSPYKSLGAEQVHAEMEILKALADGGDRGRGKTIVVKGGAGTGKTILAIYLMKLFTDANDTGVPGDEMLDYTDEDIESIIASESISGIKKIGIVMPQSTLKESIIDVFKSINGLNKKMVLSTTDVVDEFISTGEKFDLIIVDEAHRLKCRWNGHLSSYPKFDQCTEALGMERDEGNELEWIMKCSRNQIFFRDELQTVRPCDMTTEDFVAILNENCSEDVVNLELSSQWRCEGGNRYINYIKNILSDIEPKPERFDNYDLKLFKDIDKMIEAIKAKDTEVGLCRNAAGYAWSWASKKDKKAYDIEIQGHKYRWNSTYKNWIASENAVNEIGCIHTVQGYDLNYCGVIIGKDIYYDPIEKTIKADKTNYYDQQGKSGVAEKPELLKEYLTNIYLTLLTRGRLGTYIYVCDDGLREYMERFFEVVG